MLRASGGSPETILSFRVITEKEEKSYLLAYPQPLQDVAALMLETGMRTIEIFQLRKKDILLDKYGLQVTRCKTKASIRRVPLSDKAKLILEARLNRFDEGFLFPQNDNNGSAPTKALDKLHRQVISKLEYKFRLYDCRHTFATRTLESGTDPLTLSAILGHANLKRSGVRRIRSRKEKPKRFARCRKQSKSSRNAENENCSSIFRYSRNFPRPS